MVGCKEKYREERQPKICNPDISSVSETTFSRILYDFWGGFIRRRLVDRIATDGHCLLAAVLLPGYAGA